MRRPGLIVMIALAAMIAASCGGSSSTSPAGESSPAPADGDGTTTGSAAAGAGSVSFVTIGDAVYNTGSAHVEVSGGRQLTFDAQLLSTISFTSDGATLLMYPGGEGQSGSLLSIANGPDTGLAMTLSAPDITTGGDGATGCAFELTRNDASGLAGQFDCRGIVSVSGDMPTVDVRGTFSAEP